MFRGDERRLVYWVVTGHLPFQSFHVNKVLIRVAAFLAAPQCSEDLLVDVVFAGAFDVICRVCNPEKPYLNREISG